MSIQVKFAAHAPVDQVAKVMKALRVTVKVSLSKADNYRQDRAMGCLFCGGCADRSSNKFFDKSHPDSCHVLAPIQKRYEAALASPNPPGTVIFEECE